MLRCLLAVLALVAATPPALSDAVLSPPTGEVVLTVTGDAVPHNTADSAVFDLQMLAAIGETSIRTSTVWTDGVHEFKGVPLNLLVQTLGVTSGVLDLYAANDYMVEIPVGEALEAGPILAYYMDGQQMNLRDKGPIWLVYPYDSSSYYRTDVIYTRSIWQLNRIEVVP